MLILKSSVLSARALESSPELGEPGQLCSRFTPNMGADVFTGRLSFSLPYSRWSPRTRSEIAVLPLSNFRFFATVRTGAAKLQPPVRMKAVQQLYELVFKRRRYFPKPLQVEAER